MHNCHDLPRYCCPQLSAGPQWLAGDVIPANLSLIFSYVTATFEAARVGQNENASEENSIALLSPLQRKQFTAVSDNSLTSSLLL